MSMPCKRGTDNTAVVSLMDQIINSPYGTISLYHVMQ